MFPGWEKSIKVTIKNVKFGLPVRINAKNCTTKTELFEKFFFILGRRLFGELNKGCIGFHHSKLTGFIVGIVQTFVRFFRPDTREDTANSRVSLALTPRVFPRSISFTV